LFLVKLCTPIKYTENPLGFRKLTGANHRRPSLHFSMQMGEIREPISWVHTTYGYFQPNIQIQITQMLCASFL
jgi:hypothetical protein